RAVGTFGDPCHAGGHAVPGARGDPSRAGARVAGPGARAAGAEPGGQPRGPLHQQVPEGGLMRAVPGRRARRRAIDLAMRGVCLLLALAAAVPLVLLLRDMWESGHRILFSNGFLTQLPDTQLDLTLGRI